MINSNKKKCTQLTYGTVVRVHYNNNDSRRLTVEYNVNGITYRHKENITCRFEKIKKGRIVIGVKKYEYIRQGKGGQVAVMYNPEKPKQAYFPENKGKWA